MHLLVIGGTGFFGKSILDSFKNGLLKEYGITKITILARDIDSFIISYPELISKNVLLLKGDITTLTELPISDLIIYAATSTNILNNSTFSNLHITQFDEAIENFTKILVSSKSNFTKIVYCSSGAVYGKQPINLEKISEEHDFSLDLSNLSIEKQTYILNKRFSEKKILELGKFGFNVAIARCFAFSGRYLPRNQQYAYGNFIGSAEKNEKIVVNAAGVVYRSYMSANDLVLSLLKIADVSSIDCPIYNVGSDKSVSLYELAKEIALKYNVGYEFTNFNDSYILDRYVPNVDKLKYLFSN